jgi:regulator of nucleoside diphosphate kinase
MRRIQSNSEPLSGEVRPAIVVSETDHERLVNLAAAIEERTPEVALALQAELERAHVVPAEALPGHVAQMGSTVEFHADNGQRRRVTLVYPADADLAQGRLSILTPIGAALIGLSPGQSITWTGRDGRQHRLTVQRVEPPASSPAAADPELVQP